MAKAHLQFSCQNCAATYSKWQGRCDSCGEWNTIAEFAAPTGGLSSGTAPVPLRDVSHDPKRRAATGIHEFDRTLGGGIIPGSLILLGGDPGIGKSTLVLEAAIRLAQTRPVLYISGEESVEQVRLRADRLGTVPESLEIVIETDTDRAVALIASGRYEFTIVDSIQVMATGQIPAAAGSVSQVATGAGLLQRAAKSSGVATLIVGHVTKEGSLAGPKTLEHLVDVVLYLEGERSGEIRLLRSVKNRYGSTDEVGLFRMTEQGLAELSDPSALLRDRALSVLPGTVSTITLEGARPLAVEIQALASLSGLGYPRRTASGVSLSHLQLVAAVLSKRARLPLGSQDIYVSVVGGLRLSDPAIGLPLALAIASSLRDIALPAGTMAVGELGLSGEIRPVPALAKRIAEGRRLGYTHFLVPPGGEPEAGITPVNDLESALQKSGIMGRAQQAANLTK